MRDRVLSLGAFHWSCDDVEDITRYRPRGYHPVKLGDCFSTLPGDSLSSSSLPMPRYRVLHKLGHGSYVTIWLARDLLPLGVFMTFFNDAPTKLCLQSLCCS